MNSGRSNCKKVNPGMRTSSLSNGTLCKYLSPPHCSLGGCFLIHFVSWCLFSNASIYCWIISYGQLRLSCLSLPGVCSREGPTVGFMWTPLSGDVAPCLVMLTQFRAKQDPLIPPICSYEDFLPPFLNSAGCTERLGNLNIPLFLSPM